MFKICTILKKLISHEEIGKVDDRLVKYAGSCAPDSKEALALLIKYIGAEVVYDVLVNRINGGLDTKININFDGKE